MRSKISWKNKKGVQITVQGRDAASVVETAAEGEALAPADKRRRERRQRRGRR